MTKPIAILPARGGSKRVPRKNVRLFAGAPLLARTLEVAKAANVFGDVYVSTDDDEVAAIAESSGASVLARPPELSDDYATTGEVMAYELDRLSFDGHVCCLYPTAVLLSPRRLVEGFEKLQDGYRFVFSVLPFPHPVQRALRITDGGGVEMLQPEMVATRTQDLEPRYFDAGQFYWGKSAAFRGRESAMIGGRSSVVICDPGEVVDIDTPEDWERAESSYRLRDR